MRHAWNDRACKTVSSNHLALPTDVHEDGASATEDEQVSEENVHEEEHEDGEPELNTPEEREKFYQEVRVVPGD